MANCKSFELGDKERGREDTTPVFLIELRKDRSRVNWLSLPLRSLWSVITRDAITHSHANCSLSCRLIFKNEALRSFSSRNNLYPRFRVDRPLAILYILSL